ncbi:hypothetical protein [Microbulbifer sp.]|uniref:hypothetical protein n=1 Tax=Microbulbifer sp. TaxID=1908541 RepID=UPI003F391239
MYYLYTPLLALRQAPARYVSETASKQVRLYQLNCEKISDCQRVDGIQSTDGQQAAMQEAAVTCKSGK